MKIVEPTIAELNSYCREILDDKGNPLALVEKPGAYICDGQMFVIKSMEEMMESTVLETSNSNSNCNSYWSTLNIALMVAILALFIALISLWTSIRKQRAQAHEECLIK